MPLSSGPQGDKPQKHKTLIFHIGDHKTGSTSIQLAFARQDVTLKGHSLAYPADLAMNVMGQQCLAYGAARTPEDRKKAAKPLARRAKRVREADTDFVVISAEALEGVPAALFAEIVDRFFADCADEIRIIAYVRPHAARLTSSFAERTKVGVPQILRRTLTQFVNRRIQNGEFDYLPRFTTWRQSFGTAFVLRPMIRSQLHNGSVVDDFMHHAFGGIPFTVTSSGTSANESLHLEDLMRLKVLQRQLEAPQELRLKIGWEFARQVSHMPPPPTRSKLQLHRSLAKKIQSTYLQDARALDREFFEGAPLMETELQKAVDSAIDKPQSTAPEDYLPAEELRSLEILSGMIVGMLEQEEVNWPAALHAKRVRDVKKSRQRARRNSQAD